jgi:hypothetical protein
MTEMFAPLRFGTQLVETPQDWQHFESLLRAYATTDLDQPHLSSIWNDLEALPARYGPPHGAAILLSTTEQLQTSHWVWRDCIDAFVWRL